MNFNKIMYEKSVLHHKLFKICEFVHNKSICLSCWGGDEDKE